jgi:hypothetical protein
MNYSYVHSLLLKLRVRTFFFPSPHQITQLLSFANLLIHGAAPASCLGYHSISFLSVLPVSIGLDSFLIIERSSKQMLVPTSEKETHLFPLPLHGRIITRGFQGLDLGKLNRP